MHRRGSLTAVGAIRVPVCRHRGRRTAVAVREGALIFLLAVTLLWAQETASQPLGPDTQTALASEAPPQRLEFGRPAAGMIDRTVQDWVTFDCVVPEDAAALSVTVTDAPVDLDCYVRFGEPMTDWDADADHSADTNAWNERLCVSCWHDPPLVPGRCYIDVAYRLVGPSRIDGVRADRLDFSVQVDVIRARSDATLALKFADQPTASVSGKLDRANGHVLFYTVTVPEDATALRLDVSDVAGDVDLLVRRAGWPLANETAEHEATTLAGRESLVLDAFSQPPLAPGKWHVAVLDQVQNELPVSFVLHATLGRDPPVDLLAIPTQPLGRTPLERGLFATVEILTQDGRGTGTLITADGLVLTNYHVVERADGTVPTRNDLVVGLTFDTGQPARECFRASVLHYDEERDLALCEIRTGLYGQPLPAGYRFHSVPLGEPDSLAIGDRLDLIGFPDTGGVRSRLSVTYSCGHVAGFESHPVGYVMKTDAELSHGSSGGAALDAAGRLVGLPSYAVCASDGYGQLGYVVPLSLMPNSWRELIEDRLTKSP